MRKIQFIIFFFTLRVIVSANESNKVIKEATVDIMKCARKIVEKKLGGKEGIKVATKITPEVKQATKDIKNIQIKDVDLGRFCIVDGKEILLMIADDKKIHENYDTAIWANTPFFAKAMEQMFNMNYK